MKALLLTLTLLLWPTTTHADGLVTCRGCHLTPISGPLVPPASPIHVNLYNPPSTVITGPVLPGRVIPAQPVPNLWNPGQPFPNAGDSAGRDAPAGPQSTPGAQEASNHDAGQSPHQ